VPPKRGRQEGGEKGRVEEAGEKVKGRKKVGEKVKGRVEEVNEKVKGRVKVGEKVKGRVKVGE
jgi:hypothetical protein